MSRKNEKAITRKGLKGQPKRVRKLPALSVLILLCFGSLTLGMVLLPEALRPADASAKRTSKRPISNQPEAVPATQAETISQDALDQISALLQEKESRTPVQRKLSSQLIYQMKMTRGQPIADGVTTLESAVSVDNHGRTRIDIRATVTPQLLTAIQNMGGEVLSSFPQYRAIRANFPILRLEELATLNDVITVETAAEAMTQRMADLSDEVASPPLIKSTPGAKLKPGFEERAANVRAQLLRALPGAGKRQNPNSVASSGGVNVSEGVVTHRVDVARNVFNATGAGVKIGVLSDSVDFLAEVQANGDLPAVTVLPGQSGVPGTGEGTAMLEIVHDVAPNAQLFFATAFTSVASFANNIIALRTAGCDIIVDDVFYFNESPFQDGPIAQAVNQVTAGGALYFSSAGNEGSLAKNTAGVYEGNFVDSGTVINPVNGSSGAAINRFNNGTTNPNFNQITLAGIVTLFWSDPLGASTNDYDLFSLNSMLTAVMASSTTIQNGTQDPFEQLASQAANRRLVVVKKTGSADRFLHLNMNRGRFAVATTGQTKGHSSAAAAFSVAALPAAVPLGAAPNPTGPFPGFFTAANLSELFSSDGPRHMFYNANGSLANPGNPSLLADGGIFRQKPDIAAADGTLAITVGFNRFYGTSAAAPHAAAIAGLLKQVMPGATPAQIRSALTSSAIDIEGAGVDINTGAGVVMADSAIAALVGSPVINIGTINATPIGGNGNPVIEPGENASMTVQLTNFAGAATAMAVSATISTTTPNVTITNPNSNYPNIPVGGSGTNITPFTFSLSPAGNCGQKIDFTIVVTFAGGNQTWTFSVPTASPAAGSTTFAYQGAPVPIPDGVVVGSNPENNPGPPATATITVSGLTGNISDLNFRIDGSACGAPTTVGLAHTFVGDLVIELTSPAGTTVRLINRLTNAFGGENGPNICNMVLDDSGATSIQAATLGPFTGTFRSDEPLSAFNGENPNGVWTLTVTDFFNADVGTIRAFSLVITPNHCSLPSAGSGEITGRVTSADGSPLAGVTVQLEGSSTACAITDPEGNYRFDSLSAGEFFTVTPLLANYQFAPASRSFSLVGSRTEASFVGAPNTVVNANAIDSPEYFVRQQYLDFLGREPDQGGLEFWSREINQCNGESRCVRARRIDVSAAFFASPEFQQSGSYVYGLYAGTLGRGPAFNEFMLDRAQVLGGFDLESAKNILAESFARRPEFLARYPETMTAEQFVTTLLQTMSAHSGADLSSLRESLINDYQAGGRALVIRRASEADLFKTSEYNQAFVLMEYFGYLRRNVDQGGYSFWVRVLNSESANNYRGMVCAFLTSREYQLRFSPVVTRNDSECGP